MKTWEHVARGLCKASGCMCSEPRFCSAPYIYADMAMSAVLELEKAGYVFLPPIQEISDERNRSHHSHPRLDVVSSPGS